jgi:nucleoside-diphosphate-sugar epimerase
MRELAETAYMFTGPFVLDSTASERRLDLAPTSLETGIKETVAWWRSQNGSAG